MALQILDEVNRRLHRPQQRKSHLAPYFDAHYEFQTLYKSPSASRSPSPELSRTTHPSWATGVSRKRSWSSVESNSEECSASLSTKKRRANLAPRKQHTFSPRPVRHTSVYYTGAERALQSYTSNSSPRHTANRSAASISQHSKRAGQSFLDASRLAKYRVSSKVSKKTRKKNATFGNARHNDRYSLRHMPARMKTAIRRSVDAT